MKGEETCDAAVWNACVWNGSLSAVPWTWRLQQEVETLKAESLRGVEGRIVCRQTLLTAMALR
jgi:hypothetical protein